MAIDLEKRVARKLVTMAIERGWHVSVNDGEEWVLKLSRDVNAIMAALNSTGEDVLMFRDKDKERLGWAQLIWGNAPDELIADHTCDAVPEFDAFMDEHAIYAEKYAL